MSQLEQMVCGARNFLVLGVRVDLSVIAQVDDVADLVLLLQRFNAGCVESGEVAGADQDVLLDRSAFGVDVSAELTGVGYDRDVGASLGIIVKDLLLCRLVRFFLLAARQYQQ